jgi:hypothetical protein
MCEFEKSVQKDNTFTISLFEQIMCSLVSHRYPRLIRFTLFKYVYCTVNHKQATDEDREKET